MALSTGGGKTSVGFGTGGVPLATRGTGGNTGVGNMNIGASGGSPHAAGTSKFPLPGGRSTDLSIRKPLNSPAAAGAIAKFAMRVAVPLSVGMALYDLALDLGIRSRYDAEARLNTFYRVDDDSYCDYTGTGWNGKTYAQFANTSVGGGGACTASTNGTTFRSECEFGHNYLPEHTNPKTSCQMFVAGRTYALPSGNLVSGPNYVTWATKPFLTVPNEIPMAEQDLADKIASESGWSTNATRALADALNAGTDFDISGPVVTTPEVRQVPGPEVTSTRVDPATGNTITKTTKTKYEVTVGPDGTVTVKEIKSELEKEVTPGGEVVRDGELIGESETEVEPEEGTCAEGSTGTDCISLDTPDEEIPKTTKVIDFIAENLGWGSGACISAAVISTSKWSGSINFTPYCNAITTWVRPLVLAFAALMALAIAIPRGEGV